jgi:hypothetical protein
MTATLANGGKQENRRELDFYPTPPEATIALMDFLVLHGIVKPEFDIWEPACGNGAMSEVLKNYASVRSSDIRETGYGEGNVDFLSAQYDCSAVITNPPFNLSEQFIRHALTQANVVAMLVKSQYWHAAKRKDFFRVDAPAYVLPLTWRPDFLFDQRENGAKGAPTMEVLWTVWVHGNYDTRYRLLEKP